MNEFRLDDQSNNGDDRSQAKDFNKTVDDRSNEEQPGPSALLRQHQVPYTAKIPKEVEWGCCGIRLCHILKLPTPPCVVEAPPTSFHLHFANKTCLYSMTSELKINELIDWAQEHKYEQNGNGVLRNEHRCFKEFMLFN